jgi:hypothetical protein
LERNARLNSLGSVDDSDDERYFVVSDGDEEESNDEDGSFNGSDVGELLGGVPRTSERLHAPPPPRPGRRDQTMPGPRPSQREHEQERKRKKPAEHIRPLPDNRFERPAGKPKAASRKKARTGLGETGASSSRPKRLKPDDEERFLWKQFMLAKAALESGPVEPSKPSGRSGRAKAALPVAVNKRGVRLEEPEKYRMSASRHYSAVSSVVPTFSRNHQEPPLVREESALQGPDLLELLGEELENHGFLGFLQKRAATTTGDLHALNSAPSKPQSEQPSDRADKTKIFEEVVRPQLQFLYDEKRIDRDTFRELGRTITHALYVGSRGRPFDRGALTRETGYRIDEFMARKNDREGVLV